MAKCIGIDLGTTTCEMAYIDEGKAKIIPNNLGESITPSIISVNEQGEFVIGSLANKLFYFKEELAVKEVKRLMGEEVKIKLGDKTYEPYELSAVLLKYLKEYAESYLGEEVDEAVITVPANYNEKQRQLVTYAGEIAGLKVERIINEPTAAALSYGINNLDGEHQILVYDLGGGTFDITVLELFDGIIDIISSRGNNKLGGADFDKKIIKYILDYVDKEYYVDLSYDREAMVRIKEEAEKVKIELTTIDSTYISLPNIAIDREGKPINLNLPFSRELFEEQIESILNVTEDVIGNALKAAELDIDDIDIVLPVGGATRVPAVRNMLNRVFGEDKVRFTLNPEEAVASGAAIQGGIKNNEFDPVESIILTDICSYTLGIEICKEIGFRKVAGIFDPIILRDSKIPISVTQTYSTVEDFQKVVRIAVYQGEERFVSENLQIGELLVKDIPMRVAGFEDIDVTFTYNLNGMLEVRANVLSTNQTKVKIIDLNRLSRTDIRKAKEKLFEIE